MKVGLYSITYLGVWYDGPALTLKEFIQRAKRLGFDEPNPNGFCGHSLRPQ